MRIYKCTIWVIVGIVTIATHSIVLAQQPSLSDSKAKYVSVSFAIHGFEDSAQGLNTAVNKLAQTVEAISQSPQDLTPEQIDAVTVLARETNQVVMSFRQVLTQLPDTVGSLRDPAAEVAMSFAVSARENAIDPAIDSVDKKVTVWIRLVIIGLILLFIIAGIAVFNVVKQLRAVTLNLKLIAGEYTIVRKDTLPEIQQ